MLDVGLIFNDFKKMDPNLDYYDGPSLCQGGVSEWLQGFMYQGWHGEEAAIDIATTFGVDIRNRKEDTQQFNAPPIEPTKKPSRSTSSRTSAGPKTEA